MNLAAYIPGTQAWRRRRDEKLCRETGARIQEIVDGEVPATAAGRELQRHLDACIRCSQEAEVFEELKSAIARVGDEADPELVSKLERYAQRLCEEAETES